MMTDNADFIVIWEFQVAPEAQPAFEKVYGPAGDWANFFRQSPDYRGTQLFRDLDRPGRYLTFDRWSSREALHQFKQAHRDRYDAFDTHCEGLTSRETLIGEFAAASCAVGLFDFLGKDQA
jgi:heme-degrading monooxygenase HmoA